LAYADQAADLFQKGMVADTAFHTLTRAAKHVESARPEAAIHFYKKAANLYKMEGGRIREAADVLARVSKRDFEDRAFFWPKNDLPKFSMFKNVKKFKQKFRIQLRYDFGENLKIDC